MADKLSTGDFASELLDAIACLISSDAVDDLSSLVDARVDLIANGGWLTRDEGIVITLAGAAGGQTFMLTVQDVSR